MGRILFAGLRDPINMCQKNIGKVQSRHVDFSIGKVQSMVCDSISIRLSNIEEIQQKFSTFHLYDQVSKDS